MKKQMISLCMAIIMVLSMLPMSTFASETPTAPDDAPTIMEPLSPTEAPPTESPPVETVPPAEAEPPADTTPPEETAPPVEATPPAETETPEDAATQEAVTMAMRLFALTSEETLTIVPTYRDTNHNAELYYTDHTQYSLSFGITASTVDAPVLVLTVPKGIAVNYYPTALDATLAGSLADQDPVTKATDGDGNTVLTYRFKPRVASIGFNINLTPTYALRHDAEIAVTAQYFGGDTLLCEENSAIHTYNPAVAGNCVYPSFNWNSNYYNNVLTARFGEYITAMQFNYSGHYPYDAATLVSAIPDGAVIGLGSGEDFLPLVDGKSYPISDSYGGYTVTYLAEYDFLAADGASLGTGQAVRYALNEKNTFLSANGGLYFFKANLFLEFSEVGTHNKGLGAKASVTVDGEELVKNSHTKTTSTSTTMNYTLKAYNLADFLYWRY